MTPALLAKLSCSNYNPNGACSGVDISSSGKTIPLWKHKPARCVVWDGSCCLYFESVVLAGIPILSNEHLKKDAQEAERMYKEMLVKHKCEQKELIKHETSD